MHAAESLSERLRFRPGAPRLDAKSRWHYQVPGPKPACTSGAAAFAGRPVEKGDQKQGNKGDVPGSPPQQLELFALVNLGLVQSLASGILSPTEAVDGGRRI